MVTSGPMWSVFLVPVILASFAFAAVMGNGVLAARSAGRPLSAAALAGPLAEVVRLATGQRRATAAADRLLWRLACWPCRWPGYWPRWSFPSVR